MKIAMLCLLMSFNVWAKSQKRSVANLENFIKEYHVKIQKMKGAKSFDFEKLYELGIKAAKSYEKLIRKKIKSSTTVEKELEGFKISSISNSWVVPKFEFFSKMARSKGQMKDHEFFELKKILFDEDTMRPVYARMMNKKKSCTIYGEGLVVMALKELEEFRKNYPKAYEEQVVKMYKRLYRQMVPTKNNCACGKRSTLDKTIETYHTLLPNHAWSEDVKKRHGQIKSRKVRLKFNCKNV